MPKRNLQPLLGSDLAPPSPAPPLLAGFALLGVAFAAGFFLADRFSPAEKASGGSAPAAASLVALAALAVVFLISGISRWHLSERIRREMVRADPVVWDLFAHHHPFLCPLFLGPWYWRALRIGMQLVLLALMVPVLLVLLVSADFARKGDWGGAAFFLFAGSAPGALVVVVLCHIHGIWRSYQRKAGVPGTSPSAPRQRIPGQEG